MNQFDKSKVRKYSPHAGFTIVELLIVIVIIGILATLVIVSYSGIQARANNTQTISAVNTYGKALRQYAIDNGGWPASASGSNYPCLGEHSGNCAQQPPATTPSCASGTLHCTTSPSSTLNSDLRIYYNGGSITPVNLQTVTITVPGVGAVNYRGAVVHSGATSAATITIRYYLKGSNADCGNPSGIRGIQDSGFTGDTSCTIALPSPL